MKVAALTGQALADSLPDVARLRISVFKDWPYLYDGDLSYEENYLQLYRHSADAIVVGAWNEGVLVGASTGTPLLDHSDDFSRAFQDSGIDLAQVFYCAESVLLPQYRGRGIGHRFFDLREEHARSLGFRKSCFCAVQRLLNHPARPADYTPLDDFWRARGYAPLAGVIADFDWKDLGCEQSTTKKMQFWMRDL